MDLSDLAHLAAVVAELPVLPDQALVAQLPVLAEVALVVQPLEVLPLLPLLVAVLLVVLPVRVVEVALLLLLSPQSFSASTARNSPTPVQPTYERVPSTR